MDDEDCPGLLRVVRSQDRLVDAVVEQHVVAQSRRLIAERQQLLIHQDLGQVVQDRDPQPLAAPFETAERGMDRHALAAAAATDQGAHQPVTTPKQPRLIALGDLEQVSERGAQEIVRSVAEHLEKRPIAGPDAAVAIERQDRCRAVLDQGRHERGIAGVATLIASGRREADQRADAQGGKAGREQCDRRQGKGTHMACDRDPEKHQPRPGGKGHATPQQGPAMKQRSEPETYGCRDRSQPSARDLERRRRVEVRGEPWR